MDLKTTAKIVIFAGAVGGIVSKELFEGEECKIKQTDIPQESHYGFVMMTPDQTSSTSEGMSLPYTDVL